MIFMFLAQCRCLLLLVGVLLAAVSGRRVSAEELQRLRKDDSEPEDTEWEACLAGRAAIFDGTQRIASEIKSSSQAVG